MCAICLRANSHPIELGFVANERAVSMDFNFIRIVFLSKLILMLPPAGSEISWGGIEPIDGNLSVLAVSTG